IEDAGEGQHEGFIGDWITPVKQALSFQARERANFDAARGLQSLETRIARAIHQSAGILFPLPPMVAEAVKDADEQAYVTEVKHLIPRHQAKEFNTDGMPPAVDREILSHIAKLNAVDTLMKMFAKHFASIDRARSMQLVEAPIQ
ncbi:MAG: hypothetical protein J0H17_00310, partial [Rhizobiales bacterium]|nr:hypothetical protein [Hyphomicrobiales bacterium]